MLFIFYLAVIVVVSASSILMNHKYLPNSRIFLVTNDAFGVTAAIFCMVAWAPQIYTTYLLESHGSLSVITILIQFPGILMLVYFYIRAGAGFWIVLAQICAGIMTCILLIECHYYGYLKGHRGLDYVRFMITADESESEIQNIGAINDDQSRPSGTIYRYGPVPTLEDDNEKKIKTK